MNGMNCNKKAERNINVLTVFHYLFTCVASFSKIIHFNIVLHFYFSLQQMSSKLRNINAPGYHVSAGNRNRTWILFPVHFLCPPPPPSTLPQSVTVAELVL